jgi:uncharacterized protein (TIRG00374 family)
MFMASSEAGGQKKFDLDRVLRVLVQVLITIAVFAALLWYVGLGSLYNALFNINIGYLALSFLAYFVTNLLFTVRLRYVLARDEVKTAFGRTLLAQYAGMLTSDVTPGRSGYLLTPVYLTDQKVPSSKSLCGILGIQTIEFLIKVVGGIGAVVFLIETVPSTNWNQFGTFGGVNVGLLVAVFGIILMLVGAMLMAAFTWSRRAISLFDRIANSRFLKRFSGGIMGKLEEYKDSANKTRNAIPVIILITLACWILKGFEWFFLGYALGIMQIPWIGYFLIQPLVTALAFVPITPAGAGIQEFGIIGIFTLLLGIAPAQAGAFALLSRGLMIIEDLVGLPQIARTSSNLIFARNKKSTNANLDIKSS